MLLLPLILSSLHHKSSPEQHIDTPLVQQDGDYVIGAVFNIGRFEETTSDNVTFPEGYCSPFTTTSNHFYGVQRALAFRIAMEEERIKLRKKGVYLGYIIYINCDNDRVTTRIASKLGTDPKVVGVLGIDHGKFSEIFSRLTTAYSLPTVTYIYNDANLMDREKFPTMVSLIPTKRQEGKAISRFLEKMDFYYVDIWYHEQLSTNIAEYLTDDYLEQNHRGCGKSGAMKDWSYHSQWLTNGTDHQDKQVVPPADVQLILGNSFGKTRVLLKKSQATRAGNTLYMTGSSNGRTKYHHSYKEILREYSPNSDDTMVFPLSPLLNTEMKILSGRLALPWKENSDELDKLYKLTQESRKDSICDGNECATSSWLAYIVTGTRIIVRGLYDTLIQFPLNTTGGCSNGLLRRRLHEKIVEKGREIEVVLEDNVTVSVSFTNRTIKCDMKLGVYQSRTDQYHVLGTISPDSIHVTNETLLQEISHYKTRCSIDCEPGSYRTYGDPTQIVFLPCCWQCISCPRDQVSNITNQNSCRECSPHTTSNTNKTECHNVTIVYTEEGVLVGGAVLVTLGACLVILTAALVWKNKERPIVKASEPCYLYTILAGILLLFISSIMPLLKPATYTCILEYVILVIASNLITTNLLWKSIKVHAIFASANSFRRPKFEVFLKKVGQVALNAVSLSMVVVFLLISGLSKGLGWRFQNYQEQSHSPIYPKCGFDWGQAQETTRVILIAATLLPFFLPLLYFLATLVLVFKMRRFPHNFRETLNILTATLIVMFCCVMFLSGYNVSPPEKRALLRSIVLFISSLTFLLCLFLPKAFILLKKNKNPEEEKRSFMKSLRMFTDRHTKTQLEIHISKLPQKDCSSDMVSCVSVPLGSYCINPSPCTLEIDKNS